MIALLVGAFASIMSCFRIHSGPANISFYGKHTVSLAAHRSKSWTGNDIAVYGALMANHLVAGYNISLDGQPPAAWPARVNVTADVPNVLLVRGAILATRLATLTLHAAVPN
jgi:hypothetical protein